MQQTTVLAARPRGRGRALAALAIVLLTATAFVGGTASPAAADTCYHPLAGGWGRDRGYVTDLVISIEVTRSGCTVYFEAGGGCGGEPVSWQNACYWGKVPSRNGGASFMANSVERMVTINPSGNNLRIYVQHPNGNYQHRFFDLYRL